MDWQTALNDLMCEWSVRVIQTESQTNFAKSFDQFIEKRKKEKPQQRFIRKRDIASSDSKWCMDLKINK